ncbi:MAG: heavy metal translocating P-type ATPase metal-binding domain-containing protein [Ignavibacteria bacterium]
MTACYHCGDHCQDNSISVGEKIFCCPGCKTVYEILSQNNLCQYYDINKTPGIAVKSAEFQKKYEYLDDPDIKSKLINFTNDKVTTVTFSIPQMYCSSCIWLLENLFKFNTGIIQSCVNFLEKKLTVRYSEDETSLREIVELLDSIGYSPDINPGDMDNFENTKVTSKSLYYKIGVSGFAFGNIMLLSFTEYLSIVNKVDPFLQQIFSTIIIVLSLPVFFYCASDYYISAWKAFRRRIINIDVPLTLGILALFFRSLFELINHTSPGYMDSLSGLIFFLLLGKLFQNKTFETLNFERNYKSYFPISTTVIKDGHETAVPASKIKAGERIMIRNLELIPADSVLIKGRGFIDYSFVTGESTPVEKVTGDMIYAGGRQMGTAIVLEVIKETSQSYLTQLWNQDLTKQNENKMVGISNFISTLFTASILFIATAASLYWQSISISSAFNVFTATLIVACPCALALSPSFTFGNTMRIFGRNKFYLKNASIIEKLSKINLIAFDKTGTLTKQDKSIINFIGESLSPEEEKLVKSIVRNSTHPLSHQISSTITSDSFFETDKFSELRGNGLDSLIDGKRIRLGSKSFITHPGEPDHLNYDNEHTTVYLSIDNKPRGYYQVNNYYREGLNDVIATVKNYELTLLSGDNDGERANLKKFFGNKTNIYFRQSPEDKLEFIKQKQSQGKVVLMVGDGLNDAGALARSDVGISISEDIGNFSPACDAILDASMFTKLGEFLNFSKFNIGIIKISFIISLVYNIAGLSYAISGALSPLIAAILMPLSSVTVVLFTTASTNFFARRRGLL